MDRDAVLASAREAAAANAWDEAFARYSALDASGELSPEDLDVFSEAAFSASRVLEAIDARQRACASYERDGRAAEAALSALVASLLHFARADNAMASGWSSRGRRLLEGLPECRAHALLAWSESQLMGRFKQYEPALERAKDMERIARGVGDTDLVTMALSLQGFLRTFRGDVAAGLAMIDEALVKVLAGEIGTFASAEVFCEMVVSCIEVADFQRASEWLDTAERSERQFALFPGCCRVHRATVLRHRGEWLAALDEAQRGRADVEGVEVTHEAMALVDLGELHRCRGELTLADHEFRSAHDKGWSPQPGLALLRLRDGDLRGAGEMIARAVDQSADQLPALVRLLPAQVEIAIAAGDLELVESAAARLSDVASALGSSTAAAANACVAGLLERQRGNLEGAAGQLELSVRTWQQARNPYDAARTRMRLADVLDDLGDHASARLELDAARATFERLGAIPEARDAAVRLGDDNPRQVARVFMFTDIVDSTTLMSALGDDSWAAVRRWHDRMVNAAVTDHHGTVVKDTGDGYFVAFNDPALAVGCAVAIQQATAEHRRHEGFSPPVRIGLHSGSALADADDYTGRDVVIAARISALAEAEEILVSAALADHLPSHMAATSRRSAALKGIAEPVDIAAVDWR